MFKTVTIVPSSVLIHIAAVCFPYETVFYLFLVNLVALALLLARLTTLHLDHIPRDYHL